jgi:predicted  nucleic acid-binding Zn-ribbon protein
MQTHIENLVKLQSVDVERARLTVAVRALPAEIAQAEAALAGAERQAAWSARSPATARRRRASAPNWTP